MSAYGNRLKNEKKSTRLLCRGTGCLGFELCSAGPRLVARIVFTEFQLFFLFHVQEPRGEETLDQKRFFYQKKRKGKGKVSSYLRPVILAAHFI